MMSLQETYSKKINELMRELKLDNALAVPRLVKAVINVGIRYDQKNTELIKTIDATLLRITGQKPVHTKARKSIASFKIREGMEIGAMVTLRGKRMFDFLTKFIHTTLPRVRDFRGLPLSAVDLQGNITIGIREHIVFPEITSDEIERIHGLSVTVVTTAQNREDGLALFRALGFPFVRDEQ